jgi:hypothetical protein
MIYGLQFHLIFGLVMFKWDKRVLSLKIYKVVINSQSLAAVTC